MAGDALLKQSDQVSKLSVIGSTVTPKSSEQRREASQHNVAERDFLCVSNNGEAWTLVALCLRWMRPKRKLIEGTNVRDEKANLAVRGATKVLGRNHVGELLAELTRAARQEELDFMHVWHVWVVVPVTESWSVMG